jgi:TatD DNase family protein
MDIPYIDLHTHRCGPKSGVEKVCTYRLGCGESLPAGCFTAGVHPWDAGKVWEGVLDFFKKPPPGLVGLGEIGLDFAVRDADRAVQIEWLRRQLGVAERLGLPVVLHCVRAYNEMQAELRKYRLKAVVFHGFTGSPELAGQLAGRGYALSFNTLSLQSPKTIEALKVTPSECLFLETDDNPAADLERLYDEVAVLRGTTLETLKETVFLNYEFRIMKCRK